VSLLVDPAAPLLPLARQGSQLRPWNPNARLVSFGHDGRLEAGGEWMMYLRSLRRGGGGGIRYRPMPTASLLCSPLLSPSPQTTASSKSKPPAPFLPGRPTHILIRLTKVTAVLCLPSLFPSSYCPTAAFVPSLSLCLLFLTNAGLPWPPCSIFVHSFITYSGTFSTNLSQALVCVANR
jgi:hypothetical protein